MKRVWGWMLVALWLSMGSSLAQELDVRTIEEAAQVVDFSGLSDHAFISQASGFEPVALAPEDAYNDLKTAYDRGGMQELPNNFGTGCGTLRLSAAQAAGRSDPSGG